MSFAVFKIRISFFVLFCATCLACNEPQPTVSDCYPEGECASVRHTKRKRPFSAEGGDAAKGKTLYLQKCVGCHGADGKGIAREQTRDLTEPAWHDFKTDSQIRATILEGQFKMPAFDLTGEELKDLITYLRRFDRSWVDPEKSSTY